MKIFIGIIIGIALMSALLGCQDDRHRSSSDNNRTYSVECIEGVEYWVRIQGYGAMMAPRVDSATLDFVNC